MGLKTKPSETNKTVVNYDSSLTQTPHRNPFNSIAVGNIRLRAYTEEDLMKTLATRIEQGWYQVSDIFKEDSFLNEGLRLDTELKKIDPKRLRNTKEKKKTEFFVYVSKTKPVKTKTFKKSF